MVHLERVLTAFVFLFLLMIPDLGFAMVSSPLRADALLATERAQVDHLVNTEIRENLQPHLAEHLDHVVALNSSLNDSGMSPETQALFIRGAYLALATRAPLMMDEQRFDQAAAKVLQFLSQHHTFPAAITVGVIARGIVGEGIKVGANYGGEANFYLQKGKLMMTNYQEWGAEVGVSAPGIPIASDEEFYFALCFGACYGGEPNGWYVGFDGDAAGGLGAGFFLEVGIDVSDLVQSWFGGRTYTLDDLYQSTTVYVGFGSVLGVEASIAGNVYRYRQMGPDQVLADLSSHGQVHDLSPQVMASHAGILKLH